MKKKTIVEYYLLDLLFRSVKSTTQCDPYTSTHLTLAAAAALAALDDFSNIANNILGCHSRAANSPSPTT